MAVIVASFILVPSLASAEDDSEFDIWGAADISQFATEDLSRYGKVKVVVGCCETWYEDGYAGQVNWGWMVERIESSNPSYDFYAVYLLYDMNPSINTGNPNPSSYEWAQYKNQGASATMDVSANQKVLKYLPGPSSGTESTTFGISVGVSRTGPDASFTVSKTYTTPWITIGTNLDGTWGGKHTWTIGFGADSKNRELPFESSILVVTTEGVPLDLDITMTWDLSLWVLNMGASMQAQDQFVWSKTLRVYYPPDVYLTSATTSTACNSVNLAWTQYTGSYFSAYKVFYKPSLGSAWTLFSTITAASTTNTVVTGLSSGVSYDFQVGWFVTYGYGRSSNILSAVAGCTSIVEGFVRNSGGSPVYGAGITVTNPSGSTSTATTNSNGYYSLTITELGTYRLSAAASSYTSYCKWQYANAYNTFYQVDFVLSTGTASIGPIYVWGDGGLVSGASVSVTNCYGTQVYSGRTDSNGMAPGVSGLTHGTYTIYAAWSEGAAECPEVSYAWRGNLMVTVPPNQSPTVHTGPFQQLPCYF